MSIKNRVVLITGSGSGIGKQTALRMAEQGAKVVINDVIPEKVDETVAEYKKMGLDVIGKTADISDETAVNNMFKETVDAFGGLDILVNNAGMERSGPLRKLTEEDWNITLDIDLKGAFLCCRAAHNYMVPNKHGRIINIASRAWLGGAGQTPYAAAKSGMVGITRSLALELGRNGITVNCIAPGLIHTPQWDSLPEKNKKFLLSKQPMPTLGEVDDIAHAVLYFSDDDNGFTTGQVLYVCAGRSLFSG